MRRIRKWLRALIGASIVTLAGASAFAAPTAYIEPGATSRTLLSDVAMNASAGSRTFTWPGVLGFETVVFWIDYTHANNGALTLACTVSNDGNTTDFVPTTCTIQSDGSCLLAFGGVFVSPSLSASKKYPVRMGIRGYRDFECTIAHGGTPSASDLVTVEGYLVAP